MHGSCCSPNTGVCGWPNTLRSKLVLQQRWRSRFLLRPAQPQNWLSLPWQQANHSDSTSNLTRRVHTLSEVRKGNQNNIESKEKRFWHSWHKATHQQLSMCVVSTKEGGLVYATCYDTDLPNYLYTSWTVFTWKHLGHFWTVIARIMDDGIVSTKM